VEALLGLKASQGHNSIISQRWTSWTEVFQGCVAADSVWSGPHGYTRWNKVPFNADAARPYQAASWSNLYAL